jgi:hypothetical protein
MRVLRAEGPGTLAGFADLGTYLYLIIVLRRRIMQSIQRNNSVA